MARSRDRTHATSKPIESQPVDPDQLAAALHQCTERERSPSIGTTASVHSSDVERDYQNDLQYEAQCYNALVEAGGQPSHPLSRLEEINKDPGEYQEIMSFWQQTSDWRVFSAQLDRWNEFLRFQRYARTQNDYNYWRSEWEDQCKKEKWRHGDGSENRIYLGGGIYEGTEKSWESTWEFHKKRHIGKVYARGYTPWWEFIYRKGRAIKAQGFPQYVEALKDRLARYEFTRIFQLDEDPARQDKLTTWIEYLGYIYWYYDRDATFIKQNQKFYENAWKNLVDSEVLRPRETRDFLLKKNGAGYERASERERTQKSLDSAILAVSSAERTLSRSAQSKVPLAELQKQLSDAQSTLDAAKERHRSIKKRNELINNFFYQIRSYRIAKRIAGRHSILLRWILQQISLIELELNPPKPPHLAKEVSGQGAVGKKRKRVEELYHELDKQEPDKQEPDKQEQGHGESDGRSTGRRITRSIFTADGGKELTADTTRRSAKRQKNDGRTPKSPNLSSSGYSASATTNAMRNGNLGKFENTATPI